MFREAFLGIQRGGLMSFITTMTIMISLLVLGGFLLVIVNFHEMTQNIQSKLEIMIYLQDQLSDKDIQEMGIRIKEISGVISLRFIPKDQAWIEFQKKFIGQHDIFSFVRTNPLPNSYQIRIDKVDNIPSIVDRVSSLGGIEEIYYGKEFADKLKNFINLVHLCGMLLVSLLSIATLLIIVNTIRLTVLARKNEISIMKLVGATNRFIKWPFILEGVFMGLLGALLAVMFLKFSYLLATLKINSIFPFFPLVTQGVALLFIYLSIIICGVVLGLLGGYMSISKLLKQLSKL